MKKQRLAFAKKHAHWTTEQWTKVMFSDESNFQVFKMGSTTVWRPRSSDRFDPQYTVPTVKHSQSVMVWKCFSGEKGRGGLHFLPKNKKMNANLYLPVLEDHMLNFYNIHGSEVFMHDSAACHKARKVTGYLEQKQINILEWPENAGFKSHRKLLAQDEKNYVRKENKKPWSTKRRAENSVVPGDNNEIFQKFK